MVLHWSVLLARLTCVRAWLNWTPGTLALPQSNSITAGHPHRSVGLSDSQITWSIQDKCRGVYLSLPIINVGPAVQRHSSGGNLLKSFTAQKSAGQHKNAFGRRTGEFVELFVLSEHFTAQIPTFYLRYCMPSVYWSLNNHWQSSLWMTSMGFN